MRLSNALPTAAFLLLGLAGAQQNEQVVLSDVVPGEQPRPVNIAVIGAGAGGASSAYHIRKFADFAGVPVNITVFERNAYIGGRSTTVDVYDDPSLPAELGASIFVQVNKILRSAVEELNLTTNALKLERAVPGPALGVWNGKDLVFTQQSDSWWERAKLLWKYGLAPVKAIKLMKQVVNDFLQMYDEPHFPFQSLTQVAEDVGVLPVIGVTGAQFLEDNEIKGLFGHHIVQASTRVNYAQNLAHIHGLETMVCMAAENSMSVRGGNWQIFDRMVKASGAATMLETQVTGLDKQKSGSYALKSQSIRENQGQVTQTQIFDSVVLAAPFQFAQITTSPPFKNVPDEIPYVELHVTLITTPHILSPSFFNQPADKLAPRVVLTTLPEDEEPSKGAESVGSPGFFSVSILNSITNPKSGRQENLYKIFSPSPPNSTFLSQLFGFPDPLGGNAEITGGGDITWIHRKVWNSYPYEYPRVTFEEIQLDDNLWYTSGMESFVSTMETNALMGMNVARLVVDHWEKRVGELAANGKMEIPGGMHESGRM